MTISPFHTSILYLNSTSTVFFLCFIFNVYCKTELLFIQFVQETRAQGLQITQHMLSIVPNQDIDAWKKKLYNAPQKNLVPHLENFKPFGGLMLHPKYVVGLTEAEGCFTVAFIGESNKLTCEFR